MDDVGAHRRRRYRAAALAGIDWVIEPAGVSDGVDCPSLPWAWSDPAPSYRNGMGEGQAGIVYALSVFAERTGDPRYADYARGGAAYLESVSTTTAACRVRDREAAQHRLPVRGGRCGVRLPADVPRHRRRALARRRAPAPGIPRPDRDGSRRRPQLADHGGRDRNETNPNRATGMEEGAAGIGWVFLQAYAVTARRTSWSARGPPGGG